jgi:transposase
MLQLDENATAFVGPSGTLPVGGDKKALQKLAMLIEGECMELGPTKAARKYGYSRPRYYQVLEKLRKEGLEGLHNRKRGPKTNYRRNDGAVRQIISHRFLDPDASAEVIAQKIRQCGQAISTRSVYRVFAEFGLQKKTPRATAESRAESDRRNAPDAKETTARTGRRRKP